MERCQWRCVFWGSGGGPVHVCLSSLTSHLTPHLISPHLHRYSPHFHSMFHCPPPCTELITLHLTLYHPLLFIIHPHHSSFIPQSPFSPHPHRLYTHRIFTPHSAPFTTHTHPSRLIIHPHHSFLILDLIFAPFTILTPHCCSCLTTLPPIPPVCYEALTTCTVHTLIYLPTSPLVPHLPSSLTSLRVSSHPSLPNRCYGMH